MNATVNLTPEQLAQLARQITEFALDDWLLLLLWGGVWLVAAAVGAFLGAYLRQRAVMKAVDAGFDNAKKQLAETTEISKHIEAQVSTAMWKHQTLVEWRLRLYDQLAPLANDIYCFMTRVGAWQSTTPRAAVDLKREIDRTFHVSAHLFGADLHTAYREFMDRCYKTRTGPGEEARIRRDPHRYREVHKESWQDTWDKLFADLRDESEIRDIEESYRRFADLLAREIGLQP